MHVQYLVYTHYVSSIAVATEETMTMPVIRLPGWKAVNNEVIKTADSDLCMQLFF